VPPADFGAIRRRSAKRSVLFTERVDKKILPDSGSLRCGLRPPKRSGAAGYLRWPSAELKVLARRWASPQQGPEPTSRKRGIVAAKRLSRTDQREVHWGPRRLIDKSCFKAPRPQARPSARGATMAGLRPPLDAPRRTTRRRLDTLWTRLAALSIACDADAHCLEPSEREALENIYWTAALKRRALACGGCKKNSPQKPCLESTASSRPHAS